MPEKMNITKTTLATRDISNLAMGHIKCPHCKRNLDITWGLSKTAEPEIEHAGGEYVQECPYCKKDFIVSFTVKVKYKANKHFRRYKGE